MSDAVARAMLKRYLNERVILPMLREAGGPARLASHLPTIRREIVAIGERRDAYHADTLQLCWASTYPDARASQN